MKPYQTWIGVVGGLLVAAAATLSAETYRVTVTRIDSNLYRDQQSKVLIETRYCYEFVYSDDAVVRWEGKYGNNYIVFSSGHKCDVIALR